MAERVFVDTNVFIYAEDVSAGAKHERARSVLVGLGDSSRTVISTQVLQEFFVVATRKLGLSPESARGRVETLARLDVVIVSPALVLAAIDLTRLHGLSLWDALIVRCAAAGGCRRLLTEDLNPGQVLDGVRIDDPFAGVATTAREPGPVARRPGPTRRPQRPGRDVPHR